MATDTLTLGVDIGIFLLLIVWITIDTFDLRSNIKKKYRDLIGR